MKLGSIFTFKARRALTVLAIAALTASAACLSLVPVRAAAATTPALQCQVGTQVGSNGSISDTIFCSGTIPDGSVSLNCQSPNLISDNNGVYTVAGSCTGNISLAGTSIPVTVNGTVVTINANDGSITAASGVVTVALNEGLSSTTASCSGAALSATLSPLTISNRGTCNLTASVLGIGTAQITATDGSTIDVTDSPNLVLTVNSLDIIAKASLLGLINVGASCSPSVAINLKQIFPITVPAPCSGS